MHAALLRSISMLPVIAAFASGCAIPGDPGQIDDDTGASQAAQLSDPSSPDSPATRPRPQAKALESAPADFLFMVDRSASWSNKRDRWEGLSIALASFISEHEGAQQIAATAFPRGPRGAGSCDAEDYELLDRAWTTKPSTITRFVGDLSFGGGSTLGPALEGTIFAAMRHATAMPRRTTSIVLLTDATPGDDEACAASPWERVARIAGSGFHDGRGPAVHTHVVSVIGSAVSPEHFARIDAIAAAGNGYAAVVNGSRDDVAAGAGNALATIRDRMTTCTFLVPEGVRPEELTLRSPDGSVSKATRVSDGSACSGAAFYVDDPEAPRLATLCSGRAGVGGFCEATFVRAQISGKPTVTVSATAD